MRGYLSGSGWKEYQKAATGTAATGKAPTVCGIALPGGLTESARLPEPIFTPSTKAQSGHDENISFEQAAALIGADLAAKVRDTSLALYRFAAEHALERGIIIADTKFEFGILDSEARATARARANSSSSTRCSRRTPPASGRPRPTKPGRAQASYDKQYVRDYLEAIEWNKEPPAPVLPAEVVEKTREKYWEAVRRLTA